jgi:hypothetical protein
MKSTRTIALLNFSNASDDKIRTLGQNVFKSLLNNAYFPNPTVDMKILGANVEKYVNSIPVKESRSSELAAVKNQNKAIVVMNLTSLCSYVNAVANGNRVILTTSGFDITPESKAKPAENTTPTEIVIKQGEFIGSVMLSCKAQKSAAAYDVRAKNGTLTWSEPVSSTKSSKIIIKDLIPGHIYEFQMRTLGSGGNSEWSNSISMMVV